MSAAAAPSWFTFSGRIPRRLAGYRGRDRPRPRPGASSTSPVSLRPPRSAKHTPLPPQRATALRPHSATHVTALPNSPTCRNVPTPKTRNAVNCTPDAFRFCGRFSGANMGPIRYRGFMSGEESRGCPQCGAPVSYVGRGRRPVWCSSRCRNIAAVTRRGAREAAVQIRMIDVPKAPKPRPERTPTQEERDQSAISRVVRSSRLSRDLLVRLRSRRQRGELDSEVWDDITAMLDQFVPGYSPRLSPPTPRPTAPSTPASATTLPELIQAIDRLSAGLETGRIYDRDFATLGPALERLGNAWVRRTSR